ncbi:hypothetical protein NLI96_g1647 [Meripilus lineatus]|uniref:Uncharacterized protein n=1 Tax=Meripilus lineatus TaxID=2056292 RepID=A0AAD5YMR8_9APHY|nr:hypothetical protein NLI96_g1647 [Physisporinus lineatus]
MPPPIDFDLQRRAIAVLQRDLDREREHLKAAAAPPEPEHVQETSQPAVPSSDTISTTQSETSGHKPHPRRQSTISLSSLHRAPFPHKLDLSAIPLHFNPDELPLHSGLPSPVSLAPKSSRASMPPDLLGGSVDIDLTLPDDTDLSATAMMGLDPTLGNSADKPIELDLDMDIDLFPDSTGPPAAAPSGSSPPKLKQEDVGIELDLFRDLEKATDGPSPSVKPENDILSALGTSSDPSLSGAPGHGQASQPYDLNMNLFNDDSSMADLFSIDNVGPASRSGG